MFQAGQYISALGFGKQVSRSMSDIEDLAQQLVEVQSQMAFQEDTVNALNEAVISQQKEILVLREQLALLKQRQEEAAAQTDQAAPTIVERPPHY